MLTKIFSFSSMLLLLAACAPRTAMQVQPMQTGNLLHDLKAEGCCGKNFVPSAALVEKYNLRKDNNAYYAGGFLHVAPQCKPAEVEKLGVTIGTQVDSMWTVQVPVQNLERLLQAKGVKTFEMGQKVQLKKANIGLSAADDDCPCNE
jgi:hypothetical protein